MSPSNDDALENILFMSVTHDTSHFEMSPLNDAALENMLFMLVTPDTSHFEMPFVYGSLSPLPVNIFALIHMFFMLVTLDTAHLEMSPLNDVALENMLLMGSMFYDTSITLDTSHTYTPCTFW